MPLAPWKSTDNFRRSAHQRLVDETNKNSNLIGAGGVEVLAGPTGRTVYDGRQFLKVLSRMGRIHDRGPLGSEPDYTDERYWVKLLVLEPIVDGGIEKRLKWTDETTVDGYSTIITATNSSEVPFIGTSNPPTHKLVIGTPVELTLYNRVDATGIITPIWIFTSGAIHSKGQYQGQIHQMGADNADDWLMPMGTPVLEEVVT